MLHNSEDKLTTNHQNAEPATMAGIADAAQFKTIINHLAEGLVVVDKDGKIVLTNPVAEQIMGCAMIGLNFYRQNFSFAERHLLTGEIMPAEEGPTARVLRGESFKNFRVLIKGENNEAKVVACSGTPITKDGQFSGGVILFSDVSEEEEQRLELENTRRTIEETQEALLELNTAILGITDAEQLLERIVQIFPVITGCDRVGITLYNPETDDLIPAAVYGLESEKAAEWKQGITKRDRSSPYDSYIFDEHKLLEVDFAKMVEEARAVGNEIPNPYNIKNLLAIPLAYQAEMLGLITLDHASKYHTFSPRELQVLDSMAQMVAFAIANVRVVQKARENAVLREANQLKDEFMSIVAHELRNPLSSIKGYSQLLGRQLEKAGMTAQLRNLERINDQASRMNRLIGDLLDVTRIDAGLLELQLGQCNIAELVEETLDNFQLVAAGHTLKLELAAGSEKADYSGFYDKDRLGQVIGNLLSNSIKYSPNGGLITLRLARQTSAEIMSAYQVAATEPPKNTASPNDILIHFSISDEGIGIPREQQKFLFDRFFRSSNSRASNLPGLGLGLYISYRIINLHGGQIWVESSGENQGTVFHFSLPVNNPNPI